MTSRLTPDANLIGYWGFDEALETDDALDGATFTVPANLTVTSATAVVEGRIGASRQFDGTTGFAAVTAAKLRLQGDALFAGWVQLASYNSSGSLLRTILSCGGPTTGDNLLYSVSVDSAGRLVYKHTAPAGTVVVRSVAIIKTSQFYCIMVRRSTSGANQNIEFFVDNVLIAVLDVTVNAVPSALPVPPPSANATAIFSVARSQKETDAAFWAGLLDEISVHDVARMYQAYLRGMYYQVALKNATTRLTSTHNVVAVSSADMGAGVRWWCYERDRDLYVVRESPFGIFGADTRLTTTGSGVATAAEKPELVYDPVTDTLLVLFVVGNRIYKLTAQSTDVPASINMPFTADTGGIIKAVDNADGGAFGNGGGQRQVISEDITYVNRTPVKYLGEDLPAYALGNGGGQYTTVNVAGVTVPSINFMNCPAAGGFGVAVGPRDGTQTGYLIYNLLGGSNKLLGSPTYITAGGFYFLPVVPVFGDVFYAEAIGLNSHPTGVFSNAVVYRNLEAALVGTVYYLGREGDGTDTWSAGNGGGQQDNFDDIVYVNRTPVKLSSEDAPSYALGNGGGQHGQVASTGSNRPGGLAITVELS